jgi:hypothetical protein
MTCSNIFHLKMFQLTIDGRSHFEGGRRKEEGRKEVTLLRGNQRL